MPKLTTGTILVLVAIVLFIAVGGTSLWGRYLANPGPLEAPTTVVVNPGERSPVIAQSLAAAHVISHPMAFVAAVRVMGLAHTLKAGEYQFDPHIPLRAVVNKLAMGDTLNRAVTIPEGFTVAQIIKTLSPTELGLTGDPLRAPEGSLFPDTYSFRLGTERDKLMTSMQNRMTRELTTAWQGRDTTLPYTNPNDLLTMASIIQKEAATEEEMPRIAAVFINRLRSGMKLQSDPTVIYGADYQPGTKLTKKDLTEPQPFNTYVYKGLPPTPIANPGKAALLAAAHPANDPYLYFVADPTRKFHVFSKDYAEHQRNVARYWNLVGKLSNGSTQLPADVSASLASPESLSSATANPNRPHTLVK